MRAKPQKAYVDIFSPHAPAQNLISTISTSDLGDETIF